MNFIWDFGDGNTSRGRIVTHSYSKEGNYTVTLKLEDRKGAVGETVTYALISEIPNNPPEKPTIEGPTDLLCNVLYEYAINSSDIDNHVIHFEINWGVQTEIIDEEYLQGSYEAIIQNSWTEPGIYNMELVAIDEKNATSENSSLNVTVGMHYVKNIGYLIDSTCDGIYDAFHSNLTGNETEIEIQDGVYLIDLNEDGTFDKQYNASLAYLGTYTPPLQKEDTGIPISAISFYLIISVLFIALIITAIWTVRKRSILSEIVTPETIKLDHIYYLSEKDYSKISDEEYQKISQEIDEIIKKYEEKLKD